MFCPFQLSRELLCERLRQALILPKTLRLSLALPVREHIPAFPRSFSQFNAHTSPCLSIFVGFAEMDGQKVSDETACGHSLGSHLVKFRL